jgi:ABC-2 type transport system ATP-binding protein
MPGRTDANATEIFQGDAAVFGLNRPLGPGRDPRPGANPGPADDNGLKRRAEDVVAVDVGGRAQALDEIGSGSTGARTVLRVAGVEKSFHRGIPPRRRVIHVLQGVDIEVSAGELVGLVGENGSGKSTLMQIIVGLLKRDAGEVQRPERVGYCPQTPMVWEKLTVDEHFELFARAYGLDDQRRERAVSGLLKELQFAKYRSYRIEELSGGTRQKLNLALSLMHEPDLLLLDEPYSGFDWETYLKFWEMSQRRRDAGMAILIVSHLLAERERLDRMFELCEGRVCNC